MNEGEQRESPPARAGGRRDGDESFSPQIIAESLACGKAGCPCGKRQGNGWTTHCPAHIDDKPSLNIAENEGKILLHCFAGCSQDAVIAALRERGLWPEAQRSGLTVEELAAAKGLPVAFLRELGVRDGVAGRDRDPCVDIPYCDERGEVRSIHKRLRFTGEPRFIWRKGDKVLLYGLARLHEARAAGRLLLVEGDSDCWTCWHAGIPALGVPGASMWQPEWIRYLHRIETVYVWREPDPGGDTLAAKVALDLPDIHIIDPLGIAKDASDLYLKDRAAFADRLYELMDKARPASALRLETLGEEAREAFQMSRSLLEDPALMHKVGEAMRIGGFAGNLTPAKLVYIAITSRLLARPLNLALIAPSAAGKNKAIDAALDLMPASAYHLEGAGSARVLIYGDADYEHKTVIVAEADSIPEEGPSASAVRALATDNYMAYDVTERDPETGKFTVRHIVKPGPTGLITTSIKRLGEQLSTRLLTVGVADTPEQTRAVLTAHAASVNGSQPTPEVDALVAGQRWLELAGDHGVVVPFAPALAATVPADLVRMRRDFRQLLTVIQAVALLYQRQRQRDADGNIIATLEDYALARELLLDVFTEAATGGVSQPVRETVQAVASLYDGITAVTVTGLAGALHLHRSTVWRRVQTALDLGFLVNEETRRGQPAKLMAGAPLPEERPALPFPEEVVSWGSPFLPETDATVQPEGEARYDAISERPVADPVAEPPPVAQPQHPVQPPMQPPEEPSSDTKTASEGAPVARLHADPDEKDTPYPDGTYTIPPEFTGERHYVVALGCELGFPNVTWKGGGIPAGEHYYLQAARYFSDKDIAKAIVALEALAAERSQA
jgi:hypothetical protein